MANRPSRAPGAALLKGQSRPATIVDAGLDALDFGIAIFDNNLKLVTNNRAFAELRGYPVTLCKPGTDIIELYRFNAERGDYGPGDAEAQAISRMERVREGQPHQLEYELATGRILRTVRDFRHTGLRLHGRVGGRSLEPRVAETQTNGRTDVASNSFRRSAGLHLPIPNDWGANVAAWAERPRPP